MNKKILIVCAVALALVSGNDAVAQTSWNSSSSGHWSSNSNWTSGIPDANMASMLPGGADYTVTYDSSDTAGFKAFNGFVLGNFSVTHTTTLQIGAAGFSYNGSTAQTKIEKGGTLEVLSGGVLNQGSGNNTLVDTGGSLIVRTGGTATIRAADNNKGSYLVESGGVLVIENVSNVNFGLSTGSSLNNQGTVSYKGYNPIVLAASSTLTNSGDLIFTQSSFAQSTLIIGNSETAHLTMTGGSILTPVTSLWDRGLGIGPRQSSGSSTNDSTFSQSAGAVTNNGVLLLGYSNSNTTNTASTNVALNLSGGSWVNGNSGQTSEFLQSVIVGANLTRWTNGGGTFANAAGGAMEGRIVISGSGNFTSYGNVYLGAGGGIGTLDISSGTMTVANSGSATLKLGVAGTELGNTTSSVDNSKGAITTVGTGTLKLSGGLLTVDNLVATAGHSAINFSAGTMVLSHSADVGTTGGLAVGDGTGAATLKLTASAGNYEFTNGLAIKNNSNLQAVGTVAGAATVESGAGFSVSTSGTIADVTFSNGLTLAAGSASYFDIASLASFDLAQGSAVSFGGVLNLAFTGSPTDNDQFKLFNFTSYSGNFSSVSSSGLGGGQSALFDASTGIVTVVPEPSSMVLCVLGLGLSAVAWCRQRRPGKAS